MKRGDRMVHGDKELIEKLGRNDPCPCGSGRRFQKVLPEVEPVSSNATTTHDSDTWMQLSAPVAQLDQSTGLRIRRLEVRILPGVPQKVNVP